MPDGTDTGAAHGGRGTRIAWLLAGLVPLVFLAGMLLVPRPSQGGTGPHQQAAATAVAEEEEEEEWEGWEEEAEEEELEEEEAEAGAVRDECPLRSASAHAVTKRDKLKLTIGYTTNEPFSARITIQRGHKQIGSLRRRLGYSGVLRFTEKLDEQDGGRIVTNISATGGSTGCPSRRLVLFPR